MAQYLIAVNFIDKNEEFYATIPRHRLYISEMMEDGKVLSYSLSEDRRLMWMTIQAETEVELDKVIDAMPLRRWMLMSTHTLFFHHNAQMIVPAISLN